MLLLAFTLIRQGLPPMQPQRHIKSFALQTANPANKQEDAESANKPQQSHGLTVAGNNTTKLAVSKQITQAQAPVPRSAAPVPRPAGQVLKQAKQQYKPSRQLLPDPKPEYNALQLHYLHQEHSTVHNFGYTEENFARFLELEHQHRNSIDHTYMSLQTGLTIRYREVLVDWMSSIRSKQGISPDAFCLSVLLLDRFLSCRLLEKNQLQLMGSTALWIAAKFEDIYPPDLKELMRLTDQQFPRTAFIMFEKIMLNALEFKMAMVYPHQFCERYIEAIDFSQYGDSDPESITQKKLVLTALTNYIIESSYQHYVLTGTLPSRLAASALVIALYWTGYCLNDFYPAIVQRLCNHPPSFLDICVSTMWTQLTIVSEQSQQRNRVLQHATASHQARPQGPKVSDSVLRYHLNLGAANNNNWVQTFQQSFTEDRMNQLRSHVSQEQTKREHEQQYHQ